MCYTQSTFATRRRSSNSNQRNCSMASRSSSNSSMRYAQWTLPSSSLSASASSFVWLLLLGTFVLSGHLIEAAETSTPTAAAAAEATPATTAAASATDAKDLPANFKKCQRDENFDKCLVDAVNGAIVLLKDGNKEFGIPPLEPLAVKSLVINAGNAPITLKQTLKNLRVHDMISTSRVQRYRTDLKNHLIVCDSKTDRIEMIGDYEMSGRILLLPITGSGKANMTLVNTKIEHRLIGEPFEKDGVKYMRLKEYRVSFNPQRVYMQFDNLFNDAILSQTMNRFLNDNWDIVFNELKVGYAKSFGHIFRDLSNKLFEHIPFDSIFLSSA